MILREGRFSSFFVMFLLSKDTLSVFFSLMLDQETAKFDQVFGSLEVHVNKF